MLSTELTTSKFELGAENIEGILSNIQKFDEEYRKNADEIQAIKRRKEKLEDKIKELQGKTIPSKEKKIEDAQKKINEIRRKSGEESFQEYTQKLKLKQGYEKSIGEQGGILRNIFEGKSKALEDNISFWNEEIGNLEKYTDKAKNIKYNENITLELKDKEQSLKGELGKIEDTMSSFKKKMEEVERSANEISRLEEYLYCKTSVDLVAIKDKLEGFINENESNKDSVLGVMEIFEEIEKEEKEKVSELFDKDSSISRYFNEITSGLYEDVSFNQKIGEIEVKRKDGAILEAEKLSGGAYDQLYLSIRLALGEKLLKGKKGFFIMDDPFVKADPDRLQRQIEMLKRISEWGWQVIYFSAKGEIKDVLKKSIDNGAINYVELQGVFS